MVEGEWVAAPQLLTNPTMNTFVTGVYGALNGATLSTQTIGSETYMKVTSNNTASTGANTGVAQYVAVKPGMKYTLRVRGYKTSTKPVAIFVNGYGPAVNNSIVYPGPDLPNGSSSEGWIQSTFTVPTYLDHINVIMMWRSGVNTGDVFYLNDMELYEYQPGHGNQVFADAGYTYQYHLKDHLGNVRMTFTTKDEVDSDTATLELNHVSEDRANFINYNSARFVKGSLFDKTNGDATGYAQRLSGTDNEKIGLAKSFSVMPGDVIKAEVYAKYFDASAPNLAPALQTLLSNLADPSNSVGAVVDGLSYGPTSATSIPWASAPDDDNEDAPNAYLAYIYIDRNYDPASVRLLAKQITTAALEDGTDTDHELLTLIETVKEAGYVYVYLRNDEVGSEVYFDDFKVEHVKSPVVSSQDYYSFGLSFNSYNRENSTSNQYQYNDKEVQDELSLGWLDYGARMYMPELGKWLSMDPLTEFYLPFTPYQYVRNNPVSYMDPTGMYDVYVNGEKLTGKEKRQAKRELNSMMSNSNSSSSDPPKGGCPSGHRCETDKNGHTSVYNEKGDVIGVIPAKTKSDDINAAIADVGDLLSATGKAVAEEAAYMVIGGTAVRMVFKGGRWVIAAYRVAKNTERIARLGIRATEEGLEGTIKYGDQTINYLLETSKQGSTLIVNEMAVYVEGATGNELAGKVGTKPILLMRQAVIEWAKSQKYTQIIYQYTRTQGSSSVNKGARASQVIKLD